MSDRPYLWRIDGMEEGIVRVEEDGGRILELPRHLFPSEAKEGQLLRLTRNSEDASRVTLTLAIDAEGTAAELDRSKRSTAAAYAESRKRDPGGNVTF